jgi:hypothetical protein
MSVKEIPSQTNPPKPSPGSQLSWPSSLSFSSSAICPHFPLIPLSLSRLGQSPLFLSAPIISISPLRVGSSSPCPTSCLYTAPCPPLCPPWRDSTTLPPHCSLPPLMGGGRRGLPCLVPPPAPGSSLPDTHKHMSTYKSKVHRALQAWLIAVYAMAAILSVSLCMYCVSVRLTSWRWKVGGCRRVRVSAFRATTSSNV